jgi:hypothetical protein
VEDQSALEVAGGRRAIVLDASSGDLRIAFRSTRADQPGVPWAEPVGRAALEPVTKGLCGIPTVGS